MYDHGLATLELSPKVREEENKAFLSELQEWYQSQRERGGGSPPGFISALLYGPRHGASLLHYTAGLSSDVSEHMNTIDWPNMLQAEICHTVQEYSEEEWRRRLLIRIAYFVVKYGIEKPDCELKGMPLRTQYHWARTFHESFHKLIRQKPTKPAQH